MRRIMGVALTVLLLTACSRGAARPPTTRTAFPTSSTTTTEPPATAPTTTTAPPAPTGEDDKPQVQAVKDYFRARDEAVVAKNPDLIDPYVDDETAEFFAASAKRGIIDDIAHARFEPRRILTTTLEIADSVGSDGRHQAAVRVDYAATDNNRPASVNQGFGLVLSEKRQRWLVFASGDTVITPR